MQNFATLWVIAPLLLATGCYFNVPAPKARVKKGPAFASPPAKVLAIPTDCSASEAKLCTPVQSRAVDEIARMSLEFAGLRIVNSETVNAYLRVRTIKEREGVSDTVERDERAATWATTPVAMRRKLLDEMGVDGYLTSVITVGETKNAEGQRTVSVTITISRASDASEAWTSRCSVETGRYYLADEAVGVAARCALESALTVAT